MGNAKSFILLAIGYLLVFAAVHESGKYAYRPWETLTL